MIGQINMLLNEPKIDLAKILLLISVLTGSFLIIKSMVKKKNLK